MVIGKVGYWQGNLQASKLNEASSQGFIDDNRDVENTKIDINDIFKDTIEVNEPDPAIVDSKKRKNPSIIDWPGLEDGRIATA